MCTVLNTVTLVRRVEYSHSHSHSIQWYPLLSAKQARTRPVRLFRLLESPISPSPSTRGTCPTTSPRTALQVPPVPLPFSHYCLPSLIPLPRLVLPSLLLSSSLPAPIRRPAPPHPIPSSRPPPPQSSLAPLSLLLSLMMHPGIISDETPARKRYCTCTNPHPPCSLFPDRHALRLLRAVGPWRVCTVLVLVLWCCVVWCVVWWTVVGVPCIFVLRGYPCMPRSEGCGGAEKGERSGK